MRLTSSPLRRPWPRFRSLCLSSFAAGGSALALTILLAADNGKDPANEEAVRRGHYLVHHVAQCVQCHTPRDEYGKLQRDRLMQGAAIPITSPYPEQKWAFTSPWLAGLANYDPQTVVFLLQNGHRPDGATPRPPMPSYRMTEADARAVVAYLASL